VGELLSNLGRRDGHRRRADECRRTSHGPAVAEQEPRERPRDLRRLRIRYGDDAIAVFYKTVSTGRPEKGMPVWKGVLPDETLWKIFTFLSSIQTQP